MKPLVFIFFTLLVYVLAFAFASTHHRYHLSGNRHSGKGHGELRSDGNNNFVPQACRHSDDPSFSMIKCLNAYAEERPQGFAAIVNNHVDKLKKDLNISTILQSECINDVVRDLMKGYEYIFDFPEKNSPGHVCIKADQGMPQMLEDLMYYVVPIPTKYIRKYIPYVLFVPAGLYCLIAITSIVCMWVCCWPCVGGSKIRSVEAQDDFSSKRPRSDLKPKDSNEPKAKDAAKEPSTGSKKRKDKERKVKN